MSSESNNVLDINRLAEEELLREAKQAVARAEVSGIEGFQKCPLPRTNKRFLTNTIVNNIKSNRIKESRRELRKNTPYPSSYFSSGSKKSSSTCHRHEKNVKDVDLSNRFFHRAWKVNSREWSITPPQFSSSGGNQ